jgi:hypothetical protein
MIVMPQSVDLLLAELGIPHGVHSRNSGDSEGAKEGGEAA